MKIKDLIKALQLKDQNKEVEFIVAGKNDGAVVCMSVAKQAQDIAKMLQIFSN